MLNGFKNAKEKPGSGNQEIRRLTWNCISFSTIKRSAIMEEEQEEDRGVRELILPRDSPMQYFYRDTSRNATVQSFLQILDTRFLVRTLSYAQLENFKTTSRAQTLTLCL